MAKKSAPKKRDESELVDCLNCGFCPGKIENRLVDCTSVNANPGGYKKGLWLKICKYYKPKEDAQ